MPNMTGRPGHWTMEMHGGSSAPYLGGRGIISIVRWNLRLVIFGAESNFTRCEIRDFKFQTNLTKKPHNAASGGMATLTKLYVGPCIKVYVPHFLGRNAKM